MDSVTLQKNIGNKQSWILHLQMQVKNLVEKCDVTNPHFSFFFGNLGYPVLWAKEGKKNNSS